MSTSRSFCACLLLAAVPFAAMQARPPAAVVVPEIPIGGIILWWGRAADIPYGFEACDGTVVGTKGAVITGLKPNLENKFPRGAPEHRTFVPQAFSGGGDDTLRFGRQKVTLNIAPHGFALNTAQLPTHSHAIPEQAHRVTEDAAGRNPLNTVAHSIEHAHTLAVASAANNAVGGSASYVQSVAGGAGVTTSALDAFIAPHPATSTGNVGNGSSITLTHGAATAEIDIGVRDNRPAYVDLVFLIRVK